MTAMSPGDDPRLSSGPVDSDLSLAAGDPVVGREAGGPSPLLIGGVFALVAVVLFLWLNGSRLERQNRLLTTPISNSEGVGVSPAPPLVLPATPASAPVAMPAPQFTTDNSAPPPPPANMPVGTVIPSTSGESDVLARRRAPAVVVELGEGGAMLAGNAVMQNAAAASEVAAPASAAGAQAMGAAAGAASARGLEGEGDAGGGLSGDEQFAARISGGQPERARATTLRNLSTLAPQGTIITGVLETAINSDLPGYTRAVVSRDVRSFDGKQVLIPRGSRLIGQYKSAVALGQSRAFVIWTRVIRPDGVSIQIASPGGDELGRGGLKGDVDRHFFRRFGGSILLSVLNAGVASVGQTASTQITIGSPAAAAGAAAQATFGENIPPTIKVPQGEAISIFVARDLDFSGVAPV